MRGHPYTLLFPVNLPIFGTFNFARREEGGILLLAAGTSHQLVSRTTTSDPDESQGPVSMVIRPASYFIHVVIRHGGELRGML
jgi:hypothetical protein